MSPIVNPQPDAIQSVAFGDQDTIGTTVIVCTRNRSNKVVPTVRSILNTANTEFEFILIDQSTNDETETAVAPFTSDPRFRYVRSTTVGAGKSRNIGLKMAQAEVVVYTDDDCTVPANWVANMAELFASERVGMAFCNVLPAPHDASAGFIPTYGIDVDFLATTITHKNRARGIGAGMAVRREAALAVGGFDEMLGPGARFPANEEGDLALRLLLHGWQIYETNRVAITHDGFRTWEQGKELARRNWTGVGAAYAKPIRLGKWRVFSIVFYEGFIRTALNMVAQMRHGRRPQGLRGLIYFWSGFIQGLRVPVDPKHMTFLADEDAHSQGSQGGNA